ncbi:MAG: YdcF family protein [Burkholderiales bacterium]|nr:YdcF family protein [Burkholderiales bacterium]
MAKRTGLPVLVSGGSVYGGTPEAEAMRQALEQEFGVPVRWVEARSRNTRQNAERTAEVLLPQGIRRIVLVAHSFDMPRARAEFEAAGFETVLAPTGMPGEWPEELPLALKLIPNMAALQGSYFALYELLADAARRLGI